MTWFESEFWSLFNELKEEHGYKTWDEDKEAHCVFPVIYQIG